jgi:hypothetical protein
MSRNRNFELQGALAASRNLKGITTQLPFLQKRAIQTLARRLLVQARRDIQAEYNIRADRVRKDLSLSLNRDRVRVTGHWRGVGLSQFGARQTRKGVTAAIFRGRRSLYPGAFMARLLSGNVQAVSREGEKRLMTKGRYEGKRRQPLVTHYGATVAQMLAKGRRPERLADFAAGVLGDEIDRLLTSFYQRPARPGS